MRNVMPKMHLACATDPMRPVLNYVLVTKGNVVASDANILVVHDTSDLLPEEMISAIPDRFLVHREQWKLLCRKFNRIRFKENGIEIIYQYHKIILPVTYERNMAEYNPLSDMIYPKWENTIPFKSSSTEIKQIGISATRLSNLCKAMFFGTDYLDYVKLSFFGEEKAIMVSHRDEDSKVFGIIMPIRLL